MSDRYVRLLKDYGNRVARLRAALRLVGMVEEAGGPVQQQAVSKITANAPVMEAAIYDALLAVDRQAAHSYAQAYLEIADANRFTWTGTAHLVREALATMLRTLAPDDNVKEHSWFKPETTNGRPTHKQRVRHIMQQRGASKTEREVTEQVELIEELVASVVRSTYSRASNAAHTSADRREATRLLRYFEAFAHDLLDLD